MERQRRCLRRALEQGPRPAHRTPLGGFPGGRQFLGGPGGGSRGSGSPETGGLVGRRWRRGPPGGPPGEARLLVLLQLLGLLALPLLKGGNVCPHSVSLHAQQGAFDDGFIYCPRGPCSPPATCITACRQQYVPQPAGSGGLRGTVCAYPWWLMLAPYIAEQDTDHPEPQKAVPAGDTHVSICIIACFLCKHCMRQGFLSSPASAAPMGWRRAAAAAGPARARRPRPRPARARRQRPRKARVRRQRPWRARARRERPPHAAAWLVQGPRGVGRASAPAATRPPSHSPA